VPPKKPTLLLRAKALTSPAAIKAAKIAATDRTSGPLSTKTGATDLNSESLAIKIATKTVMARVIKHTTQ